MSVAEVVVKVDVSEVRAAVLAERERCFSIASQECRAWHEANGNFDDSPSWVKSKIAGVCMSIARRIMEP